MKALITTTINDPTVLADYRRGLQDGDVIIVTGDTISPHDDIEHTLKRLPGENVYLRPEQQTSWASSEAIGWRSIQRRNVAILEAIARGAHTIVTVDDDNIPLAPEVYFHEVLLALQGEAQWMVDEQLDWWNVGGVASPPVFHRGFPLTMRDRFVFSDLKPHDQRAPVGVVAGLWLGDPDIDAIERLACRPHVTHYAPHALHGIVVQPGTWCPFNSQNTGWRASLAPLMMCWPGVGRFDDIWASYLARSVMDHLGFAVHYGPPFVRQDRNDHDLLVDLDNELHGYRYTQQVTDVLRDVSYDSMDVLTCMTQAYDALRGLPSTVIPTKTREAFDAWVIDIERIIT
jgi:hypothetical protein